MIRLGHKRVGERAIGFLAPEERSPEGDMQDDIGGIEDDKQRALGTSHTTPGEEQRRQPRHPDEVRPVESHYDRVRSHREEQRDQTHVEPQKVE